MTDQVLQWVAGIAGMVGILMGAQAVLPNDLLDVTPIRDSLNMMFELCRDSAGRRLRHFALGISDGSLLRATDERQNPFRALMADMEAHFACMGRLRRLMVWTVRIRRLRIAGQVCGILAVVLVVVSLGAPSIVWPSFFVAVVGVAAPVLALLFAEWPLRREHESLQADPLCSKVDQEP